MRIAKTRWFTGGSLYENIFNYSLRAGDRGEKLGKIRCGKNNYLSVSYTQKVDTHTVLGVIYGRENFIAVIRWQFGTS